MIFNLKISSILKLYKSNLKDFIILIASITMSPLNGHHHLVKGKL